MAEVTFRPVRQLSEYKGKGASASREYKWVFLDGNASSQAVTGPALLLGELDGVLDGGLRRVTDISFRDPDSFKAGELHKHFNTWKAVLNGYEIQTIMDHVSWKTSSMARHYIKLNQVFRSGGAVDLLSTMSTTSCWFFLKPSKGFGNLFTNLRAF